MDTPLTTPAEVASSAETLRRAAVAARAAADVAVREQWAAYEAGGIAAFRPAHEAARLACTLALEAEQALYDSGAEYAPYWHVSPRQMAAYARNGSTPAASP